MLSKIIRRLFKAAPDHHLIMVWRVKKENHALGQVLTETKLKIGSYTFLAWNSYYTPQADWK
jgi:hypothetical protein